MANRITVLQNRSLRSPAGPRQWALSAKHQLTQADHSMTLESFLQDASLLQLTEALVSRSDQVFVLPSLATKYPCNFLMSRDIRYTFNWNSRPVIWEAQVFVPRAEHH